MIKNIIDDFSRVDSKIIEKDSFEKYVNKFKTKKRILLKRELYGIIAEK